MKEVKQLTKEQAIKLYQSGVWQDMTDRQIVEFQLFQDRLCMPFGEFSRAMSIVLGRDVFTHEFADCDALKAEFLGEKEPPTLEDIVNMIPEEKRILIGDFEESAPEGFSEN